MPIRKPAPTKCINCGCLFSGLKFHPSRWKFSAYGCAKTCSVECHRAWIRNNPERKAKISAAFTGERHWNWQGGKARLNSIGRRGTGWQAARRAALKRDKHRCRDCGCSNKECVERYGRSLDVDHAVPFHNFTSAKQANRVSNLVSRCASCHRKDEARRLNVQMALPLGETRVGRHHGYARGGRVNTAKLNEVLVRQARARSAAGESGASLAKAFGISKSSMSALLVGKTWRHVPMQRV